MNGLRIFMVLPVVVSASLSAARAADAVAIDEATDRGIKFLLEEIQKKPVPDQHKDGQVALETYALVVAGVSTDHPLVQRNFARLRKNSLEHTYTISCIIFALDAAISQLEADEQFLTGIIPPKVRGGSKYHVTLEKAVNAMLRLRKKPHGRWFYHRGGGPTNYDNSNTQFAVLALGIGAKRAIPIPQGDWRAIATHFIDSQEKNTDRKVKERITLIPEKERGGQRNDAIKIVERKTAKPQKKSRKKAKDGKKASRARTVMVKPVPEVGEFGKAESAVFSRGWGYQAGKGAGWNMTNAGLSSLILAASNLRGSVSAEFMSKLNRAIRDGYGWVMSHWTVAGPGQWDYYGIYSLEKVGDLGDVKRFGAHDWFEAVSKLVLSQQHEDGGWPGGAKMGRINTAFALLVLNRATSLLTQRANRMVVTGPGSRTDSDDRDDWVYVQSLDREFHLPSLFRLLRFRPNSRLVPFVNLIVENYPVEKNGKLVPGLIKAHDELTSDRFKRLLMENLKRITGVEYENPHKYHVWHRRWKNVDLAGQGIKKEEVDWLLRVYEKTASSLPLRRKIIWALGRCQAVAATPLFIADLAHEDVELRTAAYIGLGTLPFITGAPLPPFDAAANPATRSRQLAAISKWHKRHERTK